MDRESEMRDNLFRVVTVLYIIIYARLSKEEEGKTPEEQSKSIQNQIDICQRYINDEQQKYPNIQFKVVAKLSDDGISGTTFDRADFKRLIKLIESKQANMVITKDQSRFGREHIESDNYMERWFPEHNVRYVAVLDGVDTYVPDSANNDMAPIKNWMNEMYAKHTSRSVKATKKKNALEGIWNGGEPVLGLQIDPNNEGCLILEPKGAEIVKMLADLVLDNKSLDEIVDILIEKKIPIPSIIKGNSRNLNKEVEEIWDTETIRDILTNEMITGVMVQGKTTTLSHKSKKVIYLPEEDWIRVPDKVPVIIPRERFDAIQTMLKSNKNKTTKSHDYLLKGLMRCADCGHAISIKHFKDRKNNYVECCYYKKYGRRKEVCTAHRFSYEELEKLVLDNVKNECMQYVKDNDLAEKLKNKKESKEKQVDLRLKIDKCNRNIDKLNKSIDKMYQRLDAGIIDEDDYTRMTKNTKAAINSEKLLLETYTKDLEVLKEKKVKEPNYIKIVKEFLSLKKPNRILLSRLIEVIYVNEDGTIDIHYRVKNPYKDN